MTWKSKKQNVLGKRRWFIGRKIIFLKIRKNSHFWGENNFGLLFLQILTKMSSSSWRQSRQETLVYYYFNTWNHDFFIVKRFPPTKNAIISAASPCIIGCLVHSCYGNLRYSTVQVILKDWLIRPGLA